MYYQPELSHITKYGYKENGKPVSIEHEQDFHVWLELGMGICNVKQIWWFLSKKKQIEWLMDEI